MKNSRLLITCLWILFLANVPTFAQKDKLDKSILFENNKHSLLPESKVLLNILTDSLLSFDKYQVNLSGYTDGDGEDGHNQTLSEQRVQSVKSYLIQNGIPEYAILTAAFGEQKPIADNDTEDHKQKNRRVEIRVDVEPKAPVLATAVSRLSELFDLLAPAPIEFCFNPQRDTILKCPGGTVFYVKANTFKASPQYNAKCLTMKVLEAYQNSEMTLARLTTTASGRLLETQGMFWTEVEDSEGNKIPVQNGTGLTAFVPVDTFLDDMQIFEGHRHGENDPIDWVADNVANLNRLTTADFDACNSGGSDFVQKCPLFFCGVGNFFKRLVGKPITPRLEGGMALMSMDCEALRNLLKQYGVTNIKELAKALGMKNTGEDEQLFNNRVLAKANEKVLENGTINTSKLNYYVFNVTNTGWRNCDVFSDFPPALMVAMPVDETPDNQMTVQLVFKNLRALVPGIPKDGKYYFSDIPKGQTAWLVALKYENGKPFFALKEVTTGLDAVQFEFQETTVEALKAQLKLLDV